MKWEGVAWVSCHTKGILEAGSQAEFQFFSLLSCSVVTLGRYTVPLLSF